MSEKTFTTSEVAEMLDLIVDAMDKGCTAFVAVMKAVPEFASSKPVDEWLRTFADANIEQVKGLTEIIRKG